MESYKDIWDLILDKYVVKAVRSNGRTWASRREQLLDLCCSLLGSSLFDFAVVQIVEDSVTAWLTTALKQLAVFKGKLTHNDFYERKLEARLYFGAKW